MSGTHTPYHTEGSSSADEGQQPQHYYPAHGEVGFLGPRLDQCIDLGNNPPSQQHTTINQATAVPYYALHRSAAPNTNPYAEQQGIPGMSSYPTQATGSGQQVWSIYDPSQHITSTSIMPASTSSRDNLEEKLAELHKPKDQIPKKAQKLIRERSDAKRREAENELEMVLADNGIHKSGRANQLIAFLELYKSTAEENKELKRQLEEATTAAQSAK